jgi:hypothetical protein
MAWEKPNQKRPRLCTLTAFDYTFNFEQHLASDAAYQLHALADLCVVRYLFPIK